MDRGKAWEIVRGAVFGLFIMVMIFIGWACVAALSQGAV